MTSSQANDNLYDSRFCLATTMSLPQGLTINRPSLTIFMSAVESAVSDECGSVSSAHGSFVVPLLTVTCSVLYLSRPLSGWTVIPAKSVISLSSGTSSKCGTVRKLD